MATGAHATASELHALYQHDSTLPPPSLRENALCMRDKTCEYKLTHSKLGV